MADIFDEAGWPKDEIVVQASMAEDGCGRWPVWELYVDAEEGGVVGQFYDERQARLAVIALKRLPEAMKHLEQDADPKCECPHCVARRRFIEDVKSDLEGLK